MSKEGERGRRRKENSTKKILTDKLKVNSNANNFEKITPGTQSKHHKWWTSLVIIVSVVIVTHFLKQQKDIKLAVYNEIVPYRFHKRECSQQLLAEIKDYPNCVPKQCGRFVSDRIVSTEEVNVLLATAIAGIKLAGSAGGASILDLHSGALSKNEHFVNAYHIPEFKNLLSKEFLETYQAVTGKIKKAIANNFLVGESALHLTHPTFFSKINNVTAKTVHDEYWHPHVDKEQYGSFHYTSLLYLNTFKKDFNGGRFIFIDGKNTNETKYSVEPKAGRVNAFTSGHENVHHIERVTDGIRYALTVSFTCNSALEVNNNFTTRYEL